MKLNRIIALALIPVLLQQQVVSAQCSVFSAQWPDHYSPITDHQPLFTSQALAVRSAEFHFSRAAIVAVGMLAAFLAARFPTNAQEAYPPGIVQPGPPTIPTTPTFKFTIQLPLELPWHRHKSANIAEIHHIRVELAMLLNRDMAERLGAYHTMEIDVIGVLTAKSILEALQEDYGDILGNVSHYDLVIDEPNKDKEVQENTKIPPKAHLKLVPKISEESAPASDSSRQVGGKIGGLFASALSGGLPGAAAQKAPIPRMPADFLIEALELQKLQTLPGLRSLEERHENGLLIKRIKIPYRADPQAFPKGIEVLQYELANGMVVDITTFDLLYSADGRLIAVVPVLAMNDYRFKDAELEYMDFSPYYWKPSPMGTLELNEKVRESLQDFVEKQKLDQAAIADYLKEHFAEHAQRIRSVTEGHNGNPWFYAQIDEVTGAWHTHSVDFAHIGTSIPNPRLGLRQIILPSFPTLYSAVFDAPTRDTDMVVAGNEDEGYMTRLYKRIHLRDNPSLLLAGPGPGTDAWVASLCTNQPIYSVGLNPLEIANLKATADIAGFQVVAQVRDNIFSKDGTMAFPGRVFDIISWDMMAIRHESPAKRKIEPDPTLRPLRLNKYVDGDTEGMTARLFLKGLHYKLAPGGEGLAWNAVVPNPPKGSDFFKDIVEEEHLLPTIVDEVNPAIDGNGYAVYLIQRPPAATPPPIMAATAARDALLNIVVLAGGFWSGLAERSVHLHAHDPVRWRGSLILLITFGSVVVGVAGYFLLVLLRHFRTNGLFKRNVRAAEWIKHPEDSAQIRQLLKNIKEKSPIDRSEALDELTKGIRSFTVTFGFLLEVAAGDPNPMTARQALAVLGDRVAIWLAERTVSIAPVAERDNRIQLRDALRNDLETLRRALQCVQQSNFNQSVQEATYSLRDQWSHEIDWLKRANRMENDGGNRQPPSSPSHPRMIGLLIAAAAGAALLGAAGHGAAVSAMGIAGNGLMKLWMLSSLAGLVAMALSGRALVGPVKISRVEPKDYIKVKRGLSELIYEEHQAAVQENARVNAFRRHLRAYQELIKMQEILDGAPGSLLGIWIAEDAIGTLLGARILTRPAFEEDINREAVRGTDAVSYTAKGQNIGFHLRLEALTWLKNQGHDSYVALVEEGNKASLSCWRSVARAMGASFKLIQWQEEQVAEAYYEIIFNRPRRKKLLSIGVLAAAAGATLLDHLGSGPAVATAGLLGGWFAVSAAAGLMAVLSDADAASAAAASVRTRRRFLSSLAALCPSLIGLAGALKAQDQPAPDTLQSRPPMAESAPPLLVNGWLSNYKSDQGKEALESFGYRFSEVSLFALQAADKKGTLTNVDSEMRAAVAAARQLTPSPRVILTVTNDFPTQAKSPSLLRTWIGSEKARATFIAQLLERAEAADGIDVDFENIRDNRRFTQFVEDLAAALHAKGKYLSITLEPAIFVYPSSIDVAALGDVADRIRVMAYEYHSHNSSPGPISPPAQALALANRALQQVPPDKLEIDLAAYGYDWPVIRQGQKRQKRNYGLLLDTPDEFHALVSRYFSGGLVQEETLRDPETQALHLPHAETILSGKGRHVRLTTVEHDAWMEDAQALTFVARQLHAKGIRHIGLWRIGGRTTLQFLKLLPETSSTSRANKWVGLAVMAAAVALHSMWPLTPGTVTAASLAGGKLWLIAQAALVLLLPWMEPQAAQQWREDIAHAIGRRERRLYVGITPDSLISWNDGPRRGMARPASLQLSASDWLRILPPYPEPATIHIRTNQEQKVNLSVSWTPENDMDKWTTYLDLDMSLKGDGSAEHPYKVSVIGNLDGVKIAQYLEQAGAPADERNESPTFKFFTRLTEWLQTLPWNGEAWIVATDVQSDPKNRSRQLYSRLSWENDPADNTIMRKRLAPRPVPAEKPLTWLERGHVAWVMTTEYLRENFLRWLRRHRDKALGFLVAAVTAALWAADCFMRGPAVTTAGLSAGWWMLSPALAAVFFLPPSSTDGDSEDPPESLIGQIEKHRQLIRIFNRNPEAVAHNLKELNSLFSKASADRTLNEGTLASEMVQVLQLKPGASQFVAEPWSDLQSTILEGAAKRSGGYWTPAFEHVWEALLGHETGIDFDVLKDALKKLVALRGVPPVFLAKQLAHLLTLTWKTPGSDIHQEHKLHEQLSHGIFSSLRLYPTFILDVIEAAAAMRDFPAAYMKRLQKLLNEWERTRNGSRDPAAEAITVIERYDAGEPWWSTGLYGPLYVEVQILGNERYLFMYKTRNLGACPKPLVISASGSADLLESFAKNWETNRFLLSYENNEYLKLKIQELRQKSRRGFAPPLALLPLPLVAGAMVSATHGLWGLAVMALSTALAMAVSSGTGRPRSFWSSIVNPPANWKRVPLRSKNLVEASFPAIDVRWIALVQANDDGSEVTMLTKNNRGGEDRIALLWWRKAGMLEIRRGEYVWPFYGFPEDPFSLLKGQGKDASVVACRALLLKMEHLNLPTSVKFFGYSFKLEDPTSRFVTIVPEQPRNSNSSESSSPGLGPKLILLKRAA